MTRALCLFGCWPRLPHVTGQVPRQSPSQLSEQRTSGGCRRDYFFRRALLTFAWHHGIVSTWAKPRDARVSQTIKRLSEWRFRSLPCPVATASFMHPPSVWEGRNVQAVNIWGTNHLHSGARGHWKAETFPGIHGSENVGLTVKDFQQGYERKRPESQPHTPPATPSIVCCFLDSWGRNGQCRQRCGSKLIMNVEEGERMFNI